MSIAVLKALELHDFTRKGKDEPGLLLALGLGVAAAAAAATLSADKLASGSAKSRQLVGGAVGAMTGGCVTSGCSNKNTVLALGGLFLGSALGCYGALSLADSVDKPKLKKKKKVEEGAEQRTSKKESVRQPVVKDPVNVRVGVAAMLVKAGSEQQLLMGKRIGSHGAGRFAFPGGHLEFGESWQECARREVEEETGLLVEAWTQVAITNDIMDRDGKHYITIFMKGVVGDEHEPELKEPHKCEGWNWKDWKDIKAMPDDSLFIPIVNLAKSGFEL